MSPSWSLCSLHALETLKHAVVTIYVDVLIRLHVYYEILHEVLYSTQKKKCKKQVSMYIVENLYQDIFLHFSGNSNQAACC